MTPSYCSSVVSTTERSRPIAGVVHEDVDAPEALERLGDRRGDRAQGP